MDYQASSCRLPGRAAVNDCSHIYSDGTNVSGLFSGKGDKFRVMDILAITAMEADVRILTAEIMTTHFHAIVSGRARDRQSFTVSVKRKLLNWISRNGLIHWVSGALRLSNDPIQDEDELKSKIMYVYRNSVCAGIRLVPWEYEGGAGNIYFIDHEKEGLRGEAVRELTSSMRRRMFHTLRVLPGDWRFDALEGRLLPHSYMDWRRVESLFKTPRAFLAFLAQKKDLEVKYDVECAEARILNTSESELRVEIRDKCKALFGLSRVS